MLVPQGAGNIKYGISKLPSWWRYGQTDSQQNWHTLLILAIGYYKNT